MATSDSLVNISSTAPDEDRTKLVIYWSAREVNSAAG